MRARLVMALVGCSSLLAACQPEFTLPDEDSLITCNPGDKCPGGLTCSEALGRCIRAGDDGLPLTVAGNPIWNTTRAAAGTVLQVTFSSSKRLGTDPLVQVQLPGGQVRAFAQASTNELKYVYAYRVSGDEGEGAGAVTVRLIDTFGKVADALPLGAVEFAFAGAAIAADSVKITPAYAQSGAIVSIRFKPTVAGTTVKQVRVGTATATAAAPQPTDGSFEYQFGVQGGTEGAIAITADLVSPGGAVVPSVPVGSVVTDFTAPTVESVQIEKSMTHPGDTQSVTVTLSEPLAGAPRLELRRGSANPTRFTATTLSPKRFRFEGVIRPADVGTPTFTLSQAQDLAGNTAPPADIGSIQVSTSKPALEAGSLTQVSPKAWVTTGDVLRVSFSTTAAVLDPDVRVALEGGGSIALTKDSSEPAGSGTAYVFSHTVAATDPQGGGRIDVRLTDLFGNTAGPFSVGQFIIDTAAPVAANGLIATPASPLAIGSLLVVTVSANKVLDHATLTATPSLTFTESPVSGTAAVWTHMVTAEDMSGEYSLAAKIFDRAGNATELTPAVVSFDTSVPSAGSFSVSPDFATVGTVVRAIFDATEPLAADPAVKLGDVALTKDEATSSDLHYVYTHVVQAGETQRALPITAYLKDAAGNTGSVVLGQVELDFTLITPSDITVSPANATIGDTITVVANAHKPLGTNASLLVRSPFGLSFGTPTISGSTATWTHQVTAADMNGPIDITVSVSDEAEHSFPIQLDGVATIGSAP